MPDYELPPPPAVRTWEGSSLRFSMRYSIAGLSTSMFLDTPEDRFILDCGGGVVRDMIEIERYQRDNGIDLGNNDLRAAAEAIKAIIISHPHIDHYSGLISVLNFVHLLGRKRPLAVIYPEGGDPIESMVDHFTDHLWEDIPFDINLLSLKGGDVLEMEGMRIEAFTSFHRHSKPGAVGGSVPALSYRFTYQGEVVVYTGDTGDPGPLREFVKEADLALIETTFSDPGPFADGVHLTIEQAISLGDLARDRMLIHFTAGSYHSLLKNKVEIGPLKDQRSMEGRP